MVLDTPLITTLLAALVILAITYTTSTLIDRCIADIKRRQQEPQADNVAASSVETF